MTGAELLGRLVEWSGFALVCMGVAFSLMYVLLNERADRLSAAIMDACIYIGGPLCVVGLILAELA